jgi:hypothetical protein
VKNYIVLTFSIWNHDGMTHEEITEMVGITPTEVFVKGAHKPNTLNKPMVYSFNAWFLEAGLDKYADFEQQMNALLDILEPKQEILKPLSEKYKCEFSCMVKIYYGNGESTPSIHLSQRYNRFVNNVKADFDIDLYNPTDRVE